MKKFNPQTKSRLHFPNYISTLELRVYFKHTKMYETLAYSWLLKFKVTKPCEEHPISFKSYTIGQALYGYDSNDYVEAVRVYPT